MPHLIHYRCRATQHQRCDEVVDMVYDLQYVFLCVCVRAQVLISLENAQVSANLQVLDISTV